VRRTTKVLFFLFLILLFLGGFFGFAKTSLARNSIIISAIQIEGADPSDDFIELYNTTCTNVGLSNWKLKKKTKDNSEPSPIGTLKNIIPAKGYYLWENTSKNLSDNPDYSTKTYYLYNNYSIALFDNTEKQIDSITWGINSHSFAPTISTLNPGAGYAIRRDKNNAISFENTYIPKNSSPDFISTSELDSCPKKEPPVEKITCTGKASDIKINEIYPNTEDENDEFVEIINNGADCVDISSWAIKDSTDISSHKTIFPENTILESGEYFYIEKNLYLNNDDDIVYLLDESSLEKDHQEYTNAIRTKSYSFDGINWIWTSTPTAGVENQFDLAENVFDDDIDSPAESTTTDYNIYLNEILPNPNGDEKLGEFIELYNAENSEINLAGWTLKDASKTKYIFPTDTKIAAGKYWAIYRNDFKFAMNNSGPETIYLLNKANNIISSVFYDNAKENVSYAFDGTTWRWNNILTPGKENEFEKKLKVSIVKIKANPKGNDTDKTNGEEIYLKNTSKKKVNLKTWSIATGSKTLYNHPIMQDFIIQPGKTKKITRKYSLFTLNNKKGAIELRYPDGEVASRVKYDKKKESVKDDEVYELSGKKWQWNAPAEEITATENVSQNNTPLLEKNLEDINQETELEISDEEVTLNLGKYSSENKIALVEIKFKSAGENILQSRETPGIVLGAFSARGENHKPIEIKSVNHWQKTLQKSNQLFNFLINQFIRLI